MRAILIDPFARTVTEIDHSDDWDDIRSTLGFTMLEPIDVEHDNEMFLDEDGLAKEGQKFFSMGDTILAGRALILGSTEADEHSTDASLPLEHWRVRVRWRNVRFTGMDIIEDQMVPGIWRGLVLRQIARFEEIDPCEVDLTKTQEG